MCHVTLQDHVIKEFYDFMEGTSSSCSPLRRLAAIAIMVVEMYLICNVTLQDQVFNGLCDLIGGIFLSLMSIGLVVVDI